MVLFADISVKQGWASGIRQAGMQAGLPVAIWICVADFPVARSGAIQPCPLLRVLVQADAQVVIDRQAAGGLYSTEYAHRLG